MASTDIESPGWKTDHALIADTKSTLILYIVSLEWTIVET